MKFKSFNSLALAGALMMGVSFTSPAIAQNIPFDPYYITPKLSYSSVSMEDYSMRGKYTDLVGPTYPFQGDDQKQRAFGGGLAIGYDFGAYSEYPVRLELEYMYRAKINSKYKDQALSNIPGETIYEPHNNTMHDWGASMLTGNAKASTKIQTVMTNFYLDFPTETAFTPYVQAGIGGAYVETMSTLQVSGYLASTERNGGYWIVPPTSVNGNMVDGVGSYLYRPANSKLSGQHNSWNFAWNIGAGFAYQMKDNISLDVNYRYSDFGKSSFGTSQLHYYGYKRDPAYDGTGDANFYSEIGKGAYSGDLKLSAHEVIVGLRITAW